jgi:hypothetical protein
MASISKLHGKTCLRCGSTLLGLEWDERVNEREIHDLWHCWNCNNEFIAVVASDEKQMPVADVTRPFFTSLLME